MRRRREPSRMAGVAALFRGHGIDDGDLPAHVLVALIRGNRAALHGRLGQLVHQRRHAAHLLQLLELALEVRRGRSPCPWRPSWRASAPRRRRPASAPARPGPPRRPCRGCGPPCARRRRAPAPRVFSPMPTSTMGLPVTSRTESAAPPRASPSALVRITPVRSSAVPKARAEFTASWPAMASMTNSRSCVSTARSICLHLFHELGRRRAGGPRCRR